MKKSATANILSRLRRESGQTLKINQLLNEFGRRESTSIMRRGRRSRPAQPTVNDDPRLILAELEILGLLEIKGSSVTVKKPFTLNAQISMSPTGLCFGVPEGRPALVRDIFIDRRDAPALLPGDRVAMRLCDRRKDRFEGKVVQIISRARQDYRIKVVSRGGRNILLGHLLDTPGNVTVALATENIPREKFKSLKPDTIFYGTIPGHQLNCIGGTFLAVEFSELEKESSHPDFKRIISKHNITEEFPPGLELPDTRREPDQNSVSDWKERRDLRELDTITIDGETAKDFDDAISLVIKNKKKWILFVHIADVSHYVKPGSELDLAARERATSVYLGDRVVPMLPPELSENLCSLVAHQNRLAFTAEMEVNPNSGRISKYTFYKSVIKVKRRLTYESAEAQLDASLASGDDSTLLSSLWRLAQIQKEFRLTQGRIDLNIPEVKIKECGTLEQIARLKSTMLIEECMLSANICAAEYLNKKKVNALHRIHEAMDESKLEKLNSFFNIYKIDFQLKNTKPASLQKALQAVAEHPNRQIVERTFNILMLRSFMQARYSAEPLGHWGLGFKDYAHFTSPIRRYPDLIVHRALANRLKRKKPIYKREDIDELGIHTSERERRAMDAERDLTKLNMIRLVEKSPAKKFRGVLTGFKFDRVFLELENPPVEAVVLASHLTNDPDLIIPNDFSIYIKRLSRPAFLGERWELTLESVDIEGLTLYFKPDFKNMQNPFISE